MKFADKILFDKKIFNKTPEGFIKEVVTLARVGSMEYLGSEIGVDGLKPNELYDVEVTPDELFSQKVIDSANGATATYIHPDSLEVTLDGKDSWRNVSVGHVQDIYQDGDFLKGTIFIKDAKTIQEIEEKGIKEVSLGYDSDIVRKNGKLIKTNIRANHLAIVPEGRCGSACKIGDSKQKVKQMALKTKKRLKVADSIALMFGAKTSGQKVFARKIGDTRKKVADAKKMNDSARQKLSDFEAVMTNPDATDEEKQNALDAVSTISEDIAKAIEILDGADDSVSEAETAVEGIPVGDATLPEGVSIPEELAGYVSELETERDDAVTKAEEAETKLTEAEAEIERLKAELESAKSASDTATAVADAKARFPKIKIGDAKTVREVKEAVLVGKRMYDAQGVKKLTDCAIDSEYSKLNAQSVTSNFGGKLLNDSKPKSRISQLGGKK